MVSALTLDRNIVSVDINPQMADHMRGRFNSSRIVGGANDVKEQEGVKEVGKHNDSDVKDSDSDSDREQSINTEHVVNDDDYKHDKGSEKGIDEETKGSGEIR